MHIPDPGLGPHPGPCPCPCPGPSPGPDPGPDPGPTQYSVLSLTSLRAAGRQCHFLCLGGKD